MLYGLCYGTLFPPQLDNCPAVTPHCPIKIIYVSRLSLQKWIPHGYISYPITLQHLIWLSEHKVPREEKSFNVVTLVTLLTTFHGTGF